ncbi:MAG: signal peptidase I [Thiohalomonadaceae bacterium]
MDFPLILVIASVVTGLICLLDFVYLGPRRRRLHSFPDFSAKGDKRPYLVELSRSFFPVILIVLIIRSFIIEPFRIPSGSMMPTLLVGDFILVSKFSYGLRLPVLNTRILDLGSPQRGDIIVFRYPENPKIDYIKRVVGVPGDTVSYRNKILYINGQMAMQEADGAYVGSGSGAIMTGASMRNEQLTADARHQILVLPEAPDQGFERTVGAGQYFVLGDNRDNSRDSRYWGTVPEENLVGKAFFIWMNWDTGAGVLDWSRIGSRIK